MTLGVHDVRVRFDSWQAELIMRRSVEVGPADRPNGGVGDRVLGQQQRAHAALLHGQVLLVIRSVPPPRASQSSGRVTAATVQTGARVAQRVEAAHLTQD